MDKSKVKREYKQTRRPMGVYRIKNTVNGKSYVGFGTDIPAKLNRHKAELKFGSHRNTELQTEWNTCGESSFRFEVLDEFVPEENSQANHVEELRLLAQMWIDKMEKTGSCIVVL